MKQIEHEPQSAHKVERESRKLTFFRSNDQSSSWNSRRCNRGRSSASSCTLTRARRGSVSTHLCSCCHRSLSKTVKHVFTEDHFEFISFSQKDDFCFFICSVTCEASTGVAVPVVPAAAVSRTGVGAAGVWHAAARLHVHLPRLRQTESPADTETLQRNAANQTTNNTEQQEESV